MKLPEIILDIQNNIVLTGQEQIVLTQIVRGLKNSEIAEEMNLSVNTVKTYVARIYRKCQVRNRVELTRWYLNNLEKLKLYTK